MATLTIWKFGTADGAERAGKTLATLARDGLISIHDAAIVSWPAERNRPKTRQLHSLAGSGALSGAFWGMLFGLIFFIPLLGAAIGAGLGAMSGSLTDVGINDDLINQIREDVGPGTSALFVLSSDAVLDRIRDAFDNEKPELIHTNLSSAEENWLRDVFAE